MRRTARLLIVTAIAIMAIATPAGATGKGGNSDGVPVVKPTTDTSTALVQLKGDSLATYVKTKPAQGKKIDLKSNTVKSYRAQLSALRNNFKSWLRANAPRVNVTGEFDLSLNAIAVQLNGTPLNVLAKAPMVNRVEYQGLYYPTADDPDLGIIRATQAWALNGGAPNAGAGIKVAIVDSGIDFTHPCFSDAGYATQTQLGDNRFTNNKVIVAKVFINKLNQGNYTAQAIDSHGTHVAGTVACNYDTPATASGVAIPYGISGVAPKALLGNYNVFPGTVENARSEDILNALDAAYTDGFDVANMSLGGGSHGVQDLLTVAVDNLDKANMVVAVAAGNDGPGYFTISSPGMAARALTAGASSVGHKVEYSVTIENADMPDPQPDQTTNLIAIRGDFGTDTPSAPLHVLIDVASIYGGLSDRIRDLFR